MVTRIIPSRKTTFGIAILCVLLGLLAITTRDFTYLEKNKYLSPADWVPESERTGHRRIIGLEMNRSKYFMLPELKKAAGTDPDTFREIQRQLYWMNFRFSHGLLLRNLPRTTKLYVAVPDDGANVKSLGHEKGYFLEYLREKSGWTENEIERRIRLFECPSPLIWTQDAGEMMIRPGDRVATFYKSSGDYNGYLSFLRALVDAYPQRFDVKELPESVSAEGGDLEVVWGPDRKPALLVGRHRIMNYLSMTQSGWKKGRAATQAQIEEARAAYSKAFEGLPVHIVPEKMLLHPEKDNDELFHLDMVVSVMDNHKGDRPTAFVPEYTQGPIYDASTEKRLSSTLVAKWQGEFDEAARQMAALGYKVVRLPFSDHPARSPVNFGKFRNEVTGEYSAILSKYPCHLPADDPNTPQKRMRESVRWVEDLGNQWQETGTNESLGAFRGALNDLWHLTETIGSEPNPLHDERYARMVEAGFDVIVVPNFVWGSGGIHCQILK